ncbi:hypothetical protein TBLA_0C01400 [Henningerozyma blattae CBS 6284]|uniref:Rab-GAP TBC domain-containing protein n=1 Tax=Henningerozyma blattae (strain ATCC 34711 / CBS 6284 / DSM 70876 / NBRC 10599 / NRRL Y-10934 / UCD 77-7) TaxID=1071380 RepID=I2H0Q3_HENB6|nr:hypothetical protein TBLA_0C01400 [Tetrapisispora blattae CBS 6284]CCH59955.1 hypothetical protein TBLA_0C01400 [Tetrapisispora blattae CBS 6284]
MQNILTDKLEIEKLLEETKDYDEKFLNKLRYLLIYSGLPPSSTKAYQTLRSNVWIFLNQTPMDGATNDYSSLLKHCPPSESIFEHVASTITKTFNNTRLPKRVSENSIARIICCYIIEMEEEKKTDCVDYNREPRFETEQFTSNMLLITVPLLATFFAEPMAFRMFSVLCHSTMPCYFQKNSPGVRNGTQLLKICLHSIDPQYAEYFQNSPYPLECYTSLCITTFCSCLNPKYEVCILWDFMFAFGFHLNILFVVTLLIQLKDDIIHNKIPPHFISEINNFSAVNLFRSSSRYIAYLPEGVYELLVRHLREPIIF